MKRCPTCRVARSREDFYTDKYSSDGLRSRCKACERDAKRAADDYVEKRKRRLKWCYNLTAADYEKMSKAQAGVCNICKQPERVRDHRTGTLFALAVDHDHACCPGRRSCGKCVRQLLCAACNSALSHRESGHPHLRRIAELESALACALAQA